MSLDAASSKLAPPSLLLDELLGATVYALPLPVMVADDRGYVTYLNRAFEQLMGSDRSETIGEHVSMLFLEGQLAEDDPFEDAESGGVEMPMYDASGNLRWFLVRASDMPAGNDRCFRVYAFTDITERHIAEAALAERTQLFELVMAATHDGVWDWDLRTNAMSFNDRFLEMLGYEAGAFPESVETVAELAHDSDWREANRAMEDHLRDGWPYAVTIRYRHADGDWRYILCRASAVRDASGQAYRVVGTHTDITERKRTEIELQRATRAAEEAVRAKAEFLANMSHEIRTPMTAILGFTDLLTDPNLSDDHRLEFAGTIRRNGDHLLRMINDILDLSKIDAGKLEVEEIAWEPEQLAEEVASLMRVRAAERGLQLNVRFDHSLPHELLGDPTRVRQILVNLVGNAIKFTEQGSVTVRLGDDVTAPEDAPRLLVDVIDTGIGIPADKLERIFGAFDQADTSTTRVFGGTGLGLMISRRLAELMGGTIEVESTEGVGSLFALVLPLRAAEPAASAAPPEPAECSQPPRAAGAGQRVLLAEDGVDNQRLISMLLRRAGYDPTIVGNGQLAIDAALAAEQDGDPFDVILMDMQMPVCDGYTAVRRLRAAGYDRPIVALTAHAMTGDRERCIQAGCDDFETKPVRPTALEGVISNAIATYDKQSTERSSA